MVFTHLLIPKEKQVYADEMGSKSQKGKHQEVNFEDSTSVTCELVKCRRPEIFLLTDQGRLQRTFRIQSILINFNQF